MDWFAVRAALLPIVLALAYGAVAYGFAQHVWETVARTNGHDFVNIYYSVKAVQAGASTYDHKAMEALAAQDGIAASLVPHVYPPFLSIALGPLVWFDYTSARVLWLLLSHVLLGAAVVALSRLCGIADGTQRRGPVWVPLAAALLLYQPLQLELWMAQSNIMVLALLAWGLVFALGPRPKAPLAGLLLATAAMIKVFPGLIIVVLLALRAYRQTAWAAVWLLVLTVLQLPFVPASDFAEFPRILFGSQYAAGVGLITADYSLINALSSVAYLAGDTSLQLEKTLAQPLQIAACLALPLVAAFAAFTTARNRTAAAGPYRDLLLCAASVIAMGLVMRRWWGHHLVLLLLPFYVVLQIAWRDRWRHRIPLVLALAALVWIAVIPDRSMILFTAEHGLTTPQFAFGNKQWPSLLLLAALSALVARAPLQRARTRSMMAVVDSPSR